MDSEVFVMPDGASLPSFVWRSRLGETPRAVFIGVHGFGGRGEVFGGPADRFSQLGITTYAYDQRGHGGSPVRGVWPGVSALVDDLAEVAVVVRRLHPAAPLYLYGTSMGGAVILASANAGKLPDVDGVLLLAPAVQGWRSLGLANEVLLRLAASAAPRARHRNWRMALAGISDNPELITTIRNDPDISAGMALGAIKGLFDLTTVAGRSGQALKAPTLLLYGRKDAQVPIEAITRLARDIAGPKRILFYTEGHHALDYDLQRENVFRDIDAWLTDRSAALPSSSMPSPAAEEFAA